MDKNCRSCGETKSTLEFYRHKKYKDGLKTVCKECENKDHRARYAVRKAAGEKHIKNRQETNRAGHLKRTYGITPEQYNELLEKQNHRCAICDRHESEFNRKLAVDHAHTSSEHIPEGMVRGLLCWNCNRRIIGEETNSNLFAKAADYLRQHTGWKVPDNKIKPKRRRRKKKRATA
jgi:hypothetical protein